MMKEEPTTNLIARICLECCHGRREYRMDRRKWSVRCALSGSSETSLFLYEPASEEANRRFLADLGMPNGEYYCPLYFERMVAAINDNRKKEEQKEDGII